MDANSMFRRQPLNYNNSPRSFGARSNGVLFGIRQTPAQYGGENNISSRREFFRAYTTKPDAKWTPVKASSDVIAAKKRAAIGKGTFYSTDNQFSTKRFNTNDIHHTIRRMRSSGSAAPAKKGAIY